MRAGKIGDMDIVAHARAVGRIEIGPEHRDMRAFAQRRFDRRYRPLLLVIAAMAATVLILRGAL